MAQYYFLQITNEKTNTSLGIKDGRWEVQVGGNSRNKRIPSSSKNMPQTWSIIINQAKERQKEKKIKSSQQNLKQWELRYTKISQVQVEPFGICITLWAVPRYCTSLLISGASVIQSLGLHKMSGLKCDLMMSETFKAVYTEWSKTTPPVSRVLILRGEVLKHTGKCAASVLSFRMI